MVLINKMSQASPHIRLVSELFKHSDLPIYKKVYYSGRSLYTFANQTKTSPLSFFFYNLI